MTPVGNRLLTALPERELRRLSSGLERTECRPGSVLAESGRSIDYVHFPTTCVAALVHTMANGSVSGKAIVGNEGLTGVGAFLGGEQLPGRVEVQAAGAALRMRNSRGLVRIVDRPALQRAACECYEVIRTTYEALLTIAPLGFDTGSERRYSLIV